MSTNKTGRVIRAMSELMDFVKTKTSSNIVELAGEMDLDRRSLEKIVNVINASISQAYSQGMDSVLNEIERK